MIDFSPVWTPIVTASNSEKCNYYYYSRSSSGSRTIAVALSSCCGEAMLRRKLPRWLQVQLLDSRFQIPGSKLVVFRWMLKSIMCWGRPTQVRWVPTRADGGAASTSPSATSCWWSQAGRRLTGIICQIVKLETLRNIFAIKFNWSQPNWNLRVALAKGQSAIFNDALFLCQICCYTMVSVPSMVFGIISRSYILMRDTILNC